MQKEKRLFAGVTSQLNFFVVVIIIFDVSTIRHSNITFCLTPSCCIGAKVKQVLWMLPLPLTTFTDTLVWSHFENLFCTVVLQM